MTEIWNDGNMQLTTLPRTPVCRRFRGRVDLIYEHAHPLVPCAVSVHGSASVAGGLDFNALLPRLDGVLRIYALDYKVRVSVEIPVLHQRPGMSG